MRQIAISLSHKSLESTIERLEKERARIRERTKQYLDVLSDVGIKATRARVDSISPFYKGEDISVSKGIIEETEEGFQAVIYMSGEQAIFIEFGSGVVHNGPIGTSPHPKGEELGFTIGSYNPESPNAGSSDGWWYKDKWGEWQHTLGTPSYAPLFNGSKEMIQRASEIAESVFRF